MAQVPSESPTPGSTAEVKDALNEALGGKVDVLFLLCGSLEADFVPGRAEWPAFRVPMGCFCRNEVCSIVSIPNGAKR